MGPEFTNGPAPGATYSIGNLVFNDNGAGGGTANNGIRDAAEPGIANVVVELYAADGSGNPTGSVVATTIPMSTAITASTACSPEPMWWWWM